MRSGKSPLRSVDPTSLSNYGHRRKFPLKYRAFHKKYHPKFCVREKLWLCYFLSEINKFPLFQSPRLVHCGSFSLHNTCEPFSLTCGLQGNGLEK